MGAIRKNIKYYKAQLRDCQKFCAVVKADAYGLGAKKICESIDDLVSYFAVSSPNEFFEIKDVVSKPILLLDPIYENITELIGKGCEICVSNFKQLSLILDEAKLNLDVKFKLHLAFNTGMNRFGFNRKSEILKCFKLIKKTQNVLIIGVFSHFYAGNVKNIAEVQSNKLYKLKDFLESKYKLRHLIFHIANTAGFENEKRFDMVRVGLGMFLNNNNSPFELESEVVEIQHIKKGDTVGYGGVFCATKKMKVAIVSIGYADGVFRRIAGRGFVLINGVFCKILAVCMDSIIIDVSDARVGLKDKVTLIGKNGGKEIFVCDFASWCDTIDYEIMTKISRRVERIYIGEHYANHNRKVQS